MLPTLSLLTFNCLLGSRRWSLFYCWTHRNSLCRKAWQKCKKVKKMINGPHLYSAFLVHRPLIGLYNVCLVQPIRTHKYIHTHIHKLMTQHWEQLWVQFFLLNDISTSSLTGPGIKPLTFQVGDRTSSCQAQEEETDWTESLTTLCNKMTMTVQQAKQTNSLYLQWRGDNHIKEALQILM